MLTLGLDGGGTGCRAVLADARGRILAEARGGPANIFSDPEGARATILATLETLLADAGAGPGDVALGLGLAGANVAAARAALAAALPYPRLRIETDAVAAALGALGGANGIVAAIGTGSVFARVSGGQVRQIGGWGFLMGDEGSGAVLGRTILARALRAHDGHEDVTPLLADLLQEFGGPDGIVAFAGNATPADFARLAPRVAASDDRAAQAVMADAARDVRGFIHTLRGDDAGLPVVYTGGLGPTYRDRLAAEGWPVLDARGTALDGALILARGLL